MVVRIEENVASVLAVVGLSVPLDKKRQIYHLWHGMILGMLLVGLNTIYSLKKRLGTA